MTLPELINEYKDLAHLCNNIDYSNKKSVKSNNKAVSRMYKIANTISAEFGENGIYEFAKLLNYKEDRTDIWAAIHMLEKMMVDNLTEQKALAIIKREAAESIGIKYWLKAYDEKKRL